MKKTIRKIVIFTIVVSAVSCLSQNELPREYVSPAEIVSFNSSLEISAAMDLLSEYSIQFANKPIYDPTKASGPIGIDVNGVSWERALQIILSRRGLWYIETQHFFQVVTATDNSKEAGDGPLLPSGQVLTLGNREVKIETIFFEGDRKALTEIGIDWSTFYNGKVDITADQMGALSLNESYLDVDVKIPKKVFDIDIRALFRVFDSNNIGKVLAQPQVVVTEGNEGKVQVGQDFSIKTRDFAGNIIDRFFSTGTILQVTPYILVDESKGSAIVMDIHVERSQAYPDVVSTIIKKSEANSFVQLYDQEETLIAGLYSSEDVVLRKGIPFLKDLPWWIFGVKYIFGYNRHERMEKELIIIIKASLLPDVFVRKSQSRGAGLRNLTPEKKVEKYKNNRIELDEVRGTPDNPRFITPHPNGQDSDTFETNVPVVEQRSRPETATKASARNIQSRPTSVLDTVTKTAVQDVQRGSASTRVAEKATQDVQTSLASEVVTKTADQDFQRKSDSDEVTKTVVQDIQIGNVVWAQGENVLIQWPAGTDTHRLEGRTLMTVRRLANRRTKSVGKVIVVRAKGAKTAAQAVKTNKIPLKVGDIVAANL